MIYGRLWLFLVLDIGLVPLLILQPNNHSNFLLFFIIFACFQFELLFSSSSSLSAISKLSHATLVGFRIPVNQLDVIWGWDVFKVDIKDAKLTCAGSELRVWLVFVEYLDNVLPSLHSIEPLGETASLGLLALSLDWVGCCCWHIVNVEFGLIAPDFAGSPGNVLGSWDWNPSSRLWPMIPELALGWLP